MSFFSRRSLIASAVLVGLMPTSALFAADKPKEIRIDWATYNPVSMVLKEAKLLEQQPLGGLAALVERELEALRHGGAQLAFATRMRGDEGFEIGLDRSEVDKFAWGFVGLGVHRVPDSRALRRCHGAHGGFPEARVGAQPPDGEQNSRMRGRRHWGRDPAVSGNVRSAEQIEGEYLCCQGRRIRDSFPVDAGDFPFYIDV